MFSVSSGGPVAPPAQGDVTLGGRCSALSAAHSW